MALGVLIFREGFESYSKKRGGKSPALIFSTQWGEILFDLLIPTLVHMDFHEIFIMSCLIMNVSIYLFYEKSVSDMILAHCPVRSFSR